VTPQAAVVLFGVICAATAAGAQTKGPMPQPPLALTAPAPPTFHLAPTPVPLAPPTNPGPAVVPPDGLSPLLTQPNLLFPGPRRAGPTYPASPVPAPIDQQKTQTYRNDLLNQRFQLDRQGVSPENARYREIQRQLNQPSSR
jgi:hypothetical protein